MRRQQEEEADDRGEAAAAVMASSCRSLYQALLECHRHAGEAFQRDVVCRHLNRALAECLLTSCCPEEAEAVRSLCGSAGTSLKRRQCQKAQLSLSSCLTAHQFQ